MSNEMKFSQEKWNIVLDLRDMVNNHSKTINDMAKKINSQQEKIDKLEKQLKENNHPFSDIYNGTFSDVFNGKKK